MNRIPKSKGFQNKHCIKACLLREEPCIYLYITIYPWTHHTKSSNQLKTADTKDLWASITRSRAPGRFWVSGRFSRCALCLMRVDQGAVITVVLIVSLYATLRHIVMIHLFRIVHILQLVLYLSFDYLKHIINAKVLEEFNSITRPDLIWIKY